MPTATQSIREIVDRHPSSAHVLNRFDIDLCQQADLSLEKACRELQLSVDQVLEKLAESENAESGGTGFDPEALSLSQLMRHIVRVHHQCVRQELPRLAEMAANVAAARSGQAPELQAAAGLIQSLRSEMYTHIQKEEQVLFPFIAQMDGESSLAHSPAQACFRSVLQPIFMMEQEHESAANLMAELIRITHNFEPPTSACATHIALFTGLRAYEADLKQHVHLENDVLFPRAIQLESELKARR
jgi:regulator of cell morphogenesis and NO signaling